MKRNRFNNNLVVFTFCLAFLLIIGCSSQTDTVTISADVEIPMVQFAVNEIKTALEEKGIKSQSSDNENADICISIREASTDMEAEGFIIKKDSKKIDVMGADPAGAMYGGLELAEQISLFGLDGIQEESQNPYMERRGTKFNIPLDVRTPSYTDPCDAAQNNIAEMWSFDFWKEYIDNLARYRFNYISLWSLHPFPSLVKVPDYPDVALDDVQRSTVDWEENYNTNGIGFDAPEILANPEILKKISIEEKIEFWKKVMSYARDRNVDFYVVTWNIFVNGTDGKYGITDDIDNQITRDYFRKSVKQMFLTYPDLAGIGLTTGENIKGASTEEKEDWAYETYAQGLLDASAELPGRKFTFIHRQHETGAKEIARKFAPLLDNENIEFLFSFKYAKAHVFSSTTQAFHQQYVNDIAGMKTIWTLRNDDNYYFRWGAPGFVREFILNIPHDVTRGFYYGSDQWIWGREFLMKDSEEPRQIEIVKHWYHWMMWGRLGYNPDVSDERFISILHYRYPEVDGASLFKAWQDASMIYPITTGFHWGPLDFQWYIEGCKSAKGYAQNSTGFHDVNRFINLPPHPSSGYQSIPDFVETNLKNEKSDLLSPFIVAEKLATCSSNALEGIKDFEPGNNKELIVTINDIRTMALLGKYYSDKIAGSTNVALYRATGLDNYKQEAISQLTRAYESWISYTETAMQQNINPLWTNRVGYVNWNQITEWVEDDIDIAKTEIN